MTQTAEIVRVPSGPSCWRLVVWKHEQIKRVRKKYPMPGDYISWYDEPDIEEYEETISTINDVIEVDIKNYHILRKFARDRGYHTPTLAYIQGRIQNALGPPDSDDGPTVGKLIVRLWNALDDVREYTHKLEIKLSHFSSDKSLCNVMLYKIETGEERQIG